ncbi:Hsp20/alpha crystallin family protein [Aquimarina sp. ERC-38]|uniref:Hsp20/alpha crystallin family protein n=1 Tax=Aquimarina sp. ERC-38 TaxID=2949996 RepID=UPI0022453B64|nr:Hsp20/alpha crystallin family protein [Aquimarina sp. ERC-38]UZO81468.1 Hsp20/alpha crystallin family protein [Aquimarina sp. ERC-38]
MSLIRRTNGLYPSFMEDFFEDNWPVRGKMYNQSSKIPAVNIKEVEDNFEIELAAPGMSEDNFDINIDNNTLTISVEKSESDTEQNENGRYTRQEFNYSSFQRSFSLPETVDEDAIDASYNNGVLCISIPKKEEAKQKAPRQIKVRSNTSKAMEARTEKENNFAESQKEQELESIQ